MLIDMKKQLFSVIFSIIIGTCFGQEHLGKGVNYTKEKYDAIEKVATINFGEIEDPFLVNLVNLEAPSVSGNSAKERLAKIKEEISTVYPPKIGTQTNTRSLVEPPEIINSFAGSITEDIGIPLDNHLAVNEGQVLSAMNSQIAIKTVDGEDLVGFSLSELASELNLGDRFFDPRLIYDTEAHRFIAVFLHGSMSDQTNIVIAFSNSNDATGDWNVYELTGNPNANNTWTDYPMVTVTKTDLIVTGNLIYDDEPWQTGFDETVLWQINKANGYNGDALETMLYKDIQFEGFNIRNLCPVESADEQLEENCLFLSNRNFSVENDTIFIVELTGPIGDSNTKLIVDVLKSDVPYGVPPNAEMFFGQLQTNDARVLEAFYLDNEIQFVGNTRNLDNNLAGIYHGRIVDVDNLREVTLQHIIGPDFEIGYPGISYTGVELGDRDAIITFGHTAKRLDTGISALFFDPVQGYSDMITIKEGENYIGMISGPLERWGDYAGSQTDFEDPGTCWISGFYANSARDNMPWIVKLARPGMETSSTNSIKEYLNLNVFPNPASSRVKLQFEVQEGIERIDILLYNQEGRLIKKLVRSTNIKSGLNEFSFDVSSLISGMYQINVVGPQEIIFSESIVVE